MKYSDLISFNPIEDVIQLVSAGNSDKLREYVRTYVMSDTMAENLQVPLIDQLQMDEVVDNKGVLIVGNYGTGKSHLMTVVSAVAEDADNLQYLQNAKFAEMMKPVAGKFEVLRIEIGGVIMPLYDIIMGDISRDFKERGIDFEVPEYKSVRNLKNVISDMMMAFSEKYPDKGYLIVVDEFLAYLLSRNEMEIVLDLEFFRILGEMCSKSKLRVMFGMQEKIFDNPRFSFVADTLKRVSDRFSQIIITKESTAYVVSERILKKTPEQKAIIRGHLEKFSNLYTGMSSRMEEFVDLYPIHPAYIDVFNKIYLIENRHILKNISLTIRDIFDDDVPSDAPGIISFDDYWSKIKQDRALRTDASIKRVAAASEQLEEIIDRSFPKAAYKPLAKQIIYALSVHRLTTNGLEVRFGLTAENLRDDLCLFLPMPEQDADFLLSIIKTTLKDIMTTVSGQFIIYNDSNSQYYIDVDKVVDYDEKIKQKASIMADLELNRYFYKVVYSCLDWDEGQYVHGYEIYQRDINWDSHNIFREGYLFLGLPSERSTAQPERDFYIYVMPPYHNGRVDTNNLQDEVYLFFNSTSEFKELIGTFAAANALAQMSGGRDKDIYSHKAADVRKKLIRYLSENKNTCFDVSYKGRRRSIIEVLKGRYNRDLDFKDTIDLAASLCLEEYFDGIYPHYPKMQTRITQRNIKENVRQAFDWFTRSKTQAGKTMLDSFGLLDGDKIRPECSRYAAYYIDMLKQLPPKGVINYSDIFEEKYDGMFEDKKFHISNILMPIIFMSLVYAGYATVTLKTGKTISASELDNSISEADLYEFKYLSRPTRLAVAELKQLFEMLDINPALINNPNDLETGVDKLLAAAQNQANGAVTALQKLHSGFELWGEPLVNTQTMQKMLDACNAVRTEFSNYRAKFNTPAKLNNFSLSSEQIKDLRKQIKMVRTVMEYESFRSECAPIVSYIVNIEYFDLGVEFKAHLEAAKASFRVERDRIKDGASGLAAAQNVTAELDRLRSEYINMYFEEHKKKRLDINGARRKGEIVQSSTLANLKKLCSIEILSGAKLATIEQELTALTVCYELTPAELRATPFCPHCGFRPTESAVNVHGRIDDLQTRIDSLSEEWTSTLLNTISDPIVESQKEYLTVEQRKVIDSFLSARALPEYVDDFFVNAINALLKGFEPIVIYTDELAARLEQLPPLNEQAFKSELNRIVADYARGKDADKIRIVVKSRQ